jgi:hypothetical protein
MNACKGGISACCEYDRELTYDIAPVALAATLVSAL